LWLHSFFLSQDWSEVSTFFDTSLDSSDSILSHAELAIECKTSKHRRIMSQAMQQCQIDDAITIKHLRTIHNGLLKYLEAHGGVWPQTPVNLKVAAEQKWWIETLRPFRVTAEDRMTYAVTSFEEQPNGSVQNHLR
jgi:hypothetical protein